MSNHRSIVLLFLFFSFNLISTAVNADTGTVISAVDASGYTYVEAKIGDKKLWLAGPKTKLSKGDSITVKLGEPMRNFHSKSLKRDFAAIYFVDAYTDGASSQATLPKGHAPINGSEAITAAKDLTLKKPLKRAKGGKTISEIITGKKKLSGKKIKVRGKVTKFTPAIMGKNWIHLIDGSGDGDLIVTTKDQAELGQVVVIEGTVSLDKDFGYGYFYALLIEDAKVIAK